MNILEKIIQRKEQEVASARKAMPLATLEQQEGFRRTPLSLSRFLLDPARTGIIAEFKRRSPSKGIINAEADIAEVTEAYARNGASGISVLTDADFFGGSNADLQAARAQSIPILRKEFIIDAYQVAEARAVGADAILLIAACLSPARVRELAAYARSLQLEVLLELHDAAELGHICTDTTMVGINNRNLKNFAVDLRHSIELAARIPDGYLKIAESGIHDVETICTLRDAGFRGFLIGEHFMKQAHPAIAFASFVEQLKQKSACG